MCGGGGGLRLSPWGSGPPYFCGPQTSERGKMCIPMKIYVPFRLHIERSMNQYKLLSLQGPRGLHQTTTEPNHIICLLGWIVDTHY